MSTEKEISQDFEQSSGHFFISRSQYTAVTALLLYWKENDVHPKGEVTTLRHLFEHELNYSTVTLEIPTESASAQLELNREIAAFTARNSTHADTLIVIYYAGHCYPDENGKAQWAACVISAAESFLTPFADGKTSYENGEPKLAWWKTQQMLYDAIGDVLVLLDCCSAALVSEGNKLGGKFEVLGAAAKGVLTPYPGRRSFTTLLVRQIQKELGNRQNLSVRSLHGQLLNNKGITGTTRIFCHQREEC